MGRNAVDRLRAGGLVAKKGALALVAIDDIWIPPAGHALAHPRADDPLDQDLVDDIVLKGEIEKSILVRDDGVSDGRRRLTLVDGARRTVNGREAQRRLREALVLRETESNPTAALFVQVEFFTGSDAALLLKRLERNGEDPLKKADRASVLAITVRQLLALHATVEEIVPVMPRGIGKREVEALADWGNLEADAADAFDSGGAPLVLLRSVLDAPRGEHMATLDKLVSAGAKTAKGATRVLRKAAETEKGAPTGNTRPRRFIVAFRERAHDLDAMSTAPLPVAKLLDFMLGDDKALDEYPAWRQAAVDAGAHKLRGDK